MELSIHSFVRKHMDVIYLAGKMREVFKEPPIVPFRRDRHICDTIVKSKTNKAVTSTSQTCRDGCEKCRLILRDQVSNTSGDSSYTRVRDGTCRTCNVIYEITFSSCDSTVNVGETDRELGKRMIEHQRHVRLGNAEPIISHFGEKGQS